MADSPPEVADRLHSAALHLVRAVRVADAAMGLSPARASVMSVLVFGGPRTIGELAGAEGVRSPTMTALVNGLEADNLVRKRASGEDGRKVIVEATPAGKRILRRGRERRVALLRGLLADVPARDVKVLDRAATVMEEMVSALREGRGGP